MSTYRRVAVPGAISFFTVRLAGWRSQALVEHADALRAAFVATAREHPVRVDAMVMLPEHLHAVWRLPEGDADFPLRGRKLKTRFTRAVGRRVGDSPTPWRRSESKVRKGERGLWQRRYWEHMIRDAEDWRRHVGYCWFNPVRHGLVGAVRDWPLSSFHRDVRRGLVPADWRGAADEGEFGE
ncbi:MAG: transposase [Amaricoccus sp.]